MRQRLYPWQEECLGQWFLSDCRGIIQAVTGSGKTTLAIAAIEKLKKTMGEALRVKIVVPQAALAAQWSTALRRTGGLSQDEIGFYYGGRKETGDRFCMIYVVNSARYTLARHILRDMAAGNNIFLIADECHHYASEENRKIFEFLPRMQSYDRRFCAMGLSATPDADGFEEYLVPALGNIIYRYTFDDAAKNRTISPFVICNIALSFDGEDSEDYQDLSFEITNLSKKMIRMVPELKKLDGIAYFRALRHIAMDKEQPDIAGTAAALLHTYFLRKELVYEAPARIDGAVSLVACLDEESRILIFGERIRQAEELYVRLKEIFPGQVGIYHSHLDETVNRAMLNRYRNGEIRILVTCRALDEGLDVPQTNVGIILSSTSVERQRVQRLGRILRRSEQGELAALYYFYVENTTDPYTYMEDFCSPPVRTLFMSYLEGEDRFIHPVYEKMAASLLAGLVLEGADQGEQLEMRRCLNHGLCRADWLMDARYLDKNIKKAASVREKNYWMCMKKMRDEDMQCTQTFRQVSDSDDAGSFADGCCECW